MFVLRFIPESQDSLIVLRAMQRSDWRLESEWQVCRSRAIDVFEEFQTIVFLFYLCIDFTESFIQFGVYWHFRCMRMIMTSIVSGDAGDVELLVIWSCSSLLYLFLQVIGSVIDY